MRSAISSTICSSYALGDESGLRLTSYPDPSKRPQVPLSYGFEAWTGLEYTAATGMIYNGHDPGCHYKSVTDVTLTTL